MTEQLNTFKDLKHKILQITCEMNVLNQKHIFRINQDTEHMWIRLKKEVRMR